MWNPVSKNQNDSPEPKKDSSEDININVNRPKDTKPPGFHSSFIVSVPSTFWRSFFKSFPSEFRPGVNKESNEDPYKIPSFASESSKQKHLGKLKERQDKIQ